MKPTAAPLNFFFRVTTEPSKPWVNLTKLERIAPAMVRGKKGFISGFDLYFSEERFITVTDPFEVRTLAEMLGYEIEPADSK
jgi:hypothetical protein